MQLCIVHLVRAALRYVSTEDSKQVVRGPEEDLPSGDRLRSGSRRWTNSLKRGTTKYPTIAKQWRAKWNDIITLFDFPPPIRKAIYTTNAIESVNSVIRKFTRNRKIYPNEESALKLIYMAIHEASKKMDRADPSLETGPQPLRHHVRRPDARTKEQLTFQRWRDTKILTGPGCRNAEAGQAFQFDREYNGVHYSSLDQLSDRESLVRDIA